MRKVQTIVLFALSMLITSPSFTQSVEDSTDGGFHDILLNHLVGNWDVEAIAHNEKFTLNLDAKWVMNHQYLHIYYKSHEIIPWLKVPFEGEFFFGYNPKYKRYTVHDMTVHGDGGQYEGFCYAYQTGNEFKLMKKWANSDSITVSRFTWEPASNSWHMDMRLQVNGKEEESLVDWKLVTAKLETK